MAHSTSSKTHTAITIRGFEPEVQDLFCSRDAPKRKLEVARDVLNGPEGLVSTMGTLSLASERLDLAADRAARLGSWEVRAMQQGWGCFNPTRPIESTEWCFEQFERHEVAARVEGALARAVERIERIERIAHADGANAFFPDGLVAIVVPADPANLNLMVQGGGLSIAASTEGRIAIQLWPDKGNLHRLDAAVSRALRIAAAWVRAPLPIGGASLRDLLRVDGEVTRDQVEAGEIPSSWHEAPWCLAVAPPPRHQAALDEIAHAAGHARYGDLPTNVYGQEFHATDAGSVGEQLARCAPTPLLDTELDEAARWLSDTGLLDSNDPRDVAAVCFGDHAVERVGHPAHGFRAWAGLQLAAQRPQSIGL